MLASFVVFLAHKSFQTTVINRYRHTTLHGKVLDEKNGCITLIFCNN